MLAFGVAAALLDKCSSWDLRNYHYYNAYRFWQGGENRDVLAAHIQTYLNPLPDLPFYWLNGILPGRALAFLLGALQGINFGLLYALARRVLRGGAAIALGLAAIGMIGAGSVGEIGSTFYDYLSAMGAFASLLMMLSPPERGETNRRGLLWAFACGLPVGLATGAKLTAAPYAAAFVVTYFVFRRGSGGALIQAAACACGAAVGTLSIGGYWMAHLWAATGDPLFPFFGGLFPGGELAGAPSRDNRFLPQSLVEWLLYPLVVTFIPGRSAEVEWRDYRLLLMFLLAAVPLWRGWRCGRRRGGEFGGVEPRVFGALSLFVGLSYLGWLGLFSIWRYALPLEMLSPLIIATWVRALPLPEAARNGAAIGLLVAVTVTARPPDWGRVPWGPWRDPFVEASIPATGPGSTLVLLAGHQATAWLIPFFPEAARFVRISSDTLSSRYLRLPFFETSIEANLRQHWDDLRVLFTTEEEEERGVVLRSAEDDLARWGLAVEPGSCIAIAGNLAINGPPQLCRVRRLARR